jgi:phosphoglycolate phosphatase-like HAD superfamily hydrolase
MLRAVIFDVDGTLVDSNDLHARAWREALAHFDIDVPFDRVRSQIGKGSDQLIPSLLPADSARKLYGPLSEYRSRLFKDKYLDEVRGFPGVRDLCERILNDHRKIALASSASQEELTKLKRAANIEDLIDEETSADDSDKSKPHPDIVESALLRLKVREDEAIMIGDTPYDAIAATCLHVRTMGVLCGGFPEADLRKAGCIEIYKDPADLLANYERSALAEVPLAA